MIYRIRSGPNMRSDALGAAIVNDREEPSRDSRINRTAPEPPFWPILRPPAYDTEDAANSSAVQSTTYCRKLVA